MAVRMVRITNRLPGMLMAIPWDSHRTRRGATSLNTN